MNSHSICGFTVFDYLPLFPEYFQKLLKLFQSGNLKIWLDQGKNIPTGPFQRIRSTFDAVQVSLT